MGLLLLFLLCVNSVFANGVIESPYIEPYVSEHKAGLQINSVLTGLKGEKPNQEINLNVHLFYQDKYLLNDNDILGEIEGRLISEEPLSLFDPIEYHRTNDVSGFSNYGMQFPEYQQAVSNFVLFQEAFDQTLNSLKSKINQAEATNITNMVETLDTNSSLSNQINSNSTQSDSDSEQSEYNDSENEYEDYQYATTKLQFESQSVLLENAEELSEESSEENLSGLDKFPCISLSDLEEYRVNLSDEELKFLVRYEILKKSYNDAVEKYNNFLLSNIKKTILNPADPYERFSIMLYGRKSGKVWFKPFQLDGCKNYQAYDNVIWYLGYTLALNKKDVREIFDVFQNDTEIDYIVTGKSGALKFRLSVEFAKAVKELFELYARGRLIINQHSEFPILRD
ncbi:MAG: hypothetical protein ACRCTQ_01600 [Brevinemataceae bacterium]